MKKIGIIVLICIVAVGWYFFSVQKNPPQHEPAPNISPTKAVVVQPTVDASDLRAGGSSYSDPAGVYTVLYPSDYQLDTSDPVHPRIYKIGATQKGQTEIYDGVVVVFETIPLQGKSLSTWVDDHIRTATADGTSELIGQKRPYILTTYHGFVFELRGLGTATNYILQKEADSDYAVLITTSVNDPQKSGFQSEVNKILTTIELLK